MAYLEEICGWYDFSDVDPNIVMIKHGKRQVLATIKTLLELSPEQIVAKLHQAATELAGGKKIEEVCKTLTISPATYHRWQEQYGGADVNTVKELKAM